MVLILAPPSEQIYLVVVKRGFICEFYAGVLRSKRELAALCRAHCCEINAWPQLFEGWIALSTG